MPTLALVFIASCLALLLFASFSAFTFARSHTGLGIAAAIAGGVCLAGVFIGFDTFMSSACYFVSRFA